MKKFSFIGIIICLFAFNGCDNGSEPQTSSFEGTWTNAPYQIEVRGGNYIWQSGVIKISKGTFAFDDHTITLTPTHVWAISGWQPYEETVIVDYELKENTLVISNAPSAYAYLNGTWTRN
jgi:hypothetical protein